METLEVFKQAIGDEIMSRTGKIQTHRDRKVKNEAGKE
jgi:hypothetical protein